MMLETFAQFGPDFLKGLSTTLLLIAIAVPLGGIVALPVALGRLSRHRSVRQLLGAYTYLFRGTPLLAQVFLVYYGAGYFRAELTAIGVWWLFRDAFWCAVMVFAVNTSAYQAEILRGAIAAVARGQVEAGHALGLSRWTAFRRVILPQAMTIALRPLGNELILMLKASSIASVISVHELMGATGRAFSRTFDFQFYIWAAVCYVLMVVAVRHVWDALERHLTRHLHTEPVSRPRAEPAHVLRPTAVTSDH